MEIELWKLMGQLRVDGVGCPGREEEVDGGRVGAGDQPRLIQGIRRRDGIGEDQDTIASIRY